jgi:hypothetical protein
LIHFFGSKFSSENGPKSTIIFASVTSYNTLHDQNKCQSRSINSIKDEGVSESSITKWILLFFLD